MVGTRRLKNVVIFIQTILIFVLSRETYEEVLLRQTANISITPIHTKKLSH